MPNHAPSLLLTRPRPQSERFAKLCRERLGNVNIIVSPVLRIASIPGAMDPSEFAGVILTSENGARALASLTAVSGVRAWCVGDRTAVVARSLGMRTVSAEGDADALVAMLSRMRPEGTLLHAHGANTKGDVVTRLRAAGLLVEGCEVYDQVPIPLADDAWASLNGQRTVVLPLFSPRSAELVGNEARSAAAPLVVVALSRSVSEAWTGPEPKQLSIAKCPDSTNMLECIATLWTSLVS